MTDTLLAKAAALLEARQKATQGEWCGRLLLEITEEDSDFCDLAANTSTEIITGYQDLVRRMADALTAAEVWTDPEYDVGEWREAAMQIRDEARAAFPHTPTKS